MKPRIIKHMGIYHCHTAHNGVCRMGLGYSPALAYADWLAQ